MVSQTAKDKTELSKLYDMSIHDIISIEPSTEVLRVPGGWIYMTESYQEGRKVAVAGCFVPYYKELI